MKELRDFFENHKNELVIINFEIVKLIGFMELEDDFYWKVQRRNTVSLSSAVKIPTILKNNFIQYNQLLEDYNTQFENATNNYSF